MKTAVNRVDTAAIRQQFPVLHQQVNGKQLIYLDNAATTQKPQSVTEALLHYYQHDNANIHRGIHTLAERATAHFEATRTALKTFIGAAEEAECIFTRGTTESINLVAATFGRSYLKAGDELLITGMEHHSNIVPWQLACETSGAVLNVVPVLDNGELDLDAFEQLLSPRTRLVACVYASNALGTINPVRHIISRAHSVGACVLIDAAQAASHIEINVQELDCDFLALSAHKMYGPTGVGLLYGKRKWLDALPPYMGGGEMIREVSFEKTTWNDLPYKFEAGTPNIADVVAWKAAVDFITEIGRNTIAAHEQELLLQCTEQLSSIPGVKLVGTAAEKVGVCSFVLEGLHHFDAGMMLDARGIAVRTGHHCTQPLMKRFGIEGTIRASFAVYNTVEEVTTLTTAIQKLASLAR